eukprot:8495034-Pyramimonas_sp.AAC.1
MKHAEALPQSGLGDETGESNPNALVQKYLEQAQLLSRAMPLEDKATTARGATPTAKAALMAEASAKQASASIEMFRGEACSPEDARNSLRKTAKAAADGEG